MTISSMLVAGFLVATQITVSTAPAQGPDIYSGARRAFDAARIEASGGRSEWSSFEVIGCITVWKAWSAIGAGPAPPDDLFRALPELSITNARRMAEHWRARLEEVSSREGVTPSFHDQDIKDRYNFELTEAQDALLGAHIQPDLVFGAAGACQL